MPLPENKSYQSKHSAFLTALMIIVLWFIAAGLLIHNKQGVTDWYRLKNYKAPTSVVQISEQTTLTDYARKVFYVNSPELETKKTFSEDCPNNAGKEKTNILGCYHSNQNGIHLLDVNDTRLDGVEQVTAAHEMLHAAYDRLSNREKQEVNALLLDYYNHGLSDQRIRSVIDIYKKTEPNDLTNEMHSIFGTEIVILPDTLDNYYKKYFKNRNQVVAYSVKYQSEFTSRQTRVAEADAILSSLKKQIDNAEDDLQDMESELNRTQQKLNNLHNIGNVSEFNSMVPGYNSDVRAFNSSVEYYKTLVDKYNTLLADRNAIAFEQNELNEALSSNVSPINN